MNFTGDCLYKCSRVCRFSTMMLQVYLKHSQICDKPKDISELTETEKLNSDICPLCHTQQNTARNLLLHIFSEHQVIPKEGKKVSKNDVNPKKQIELIEIQDDDEEVIVEPVEAQNNNEMDEIKESESEIPDLDEQVSQISVRKDLYSAPKKKTNNSWSFKYTCDLCTHTATSIQKLSIHKKMIHGIKHVCDSCERVFESTEAKINHMKDAHGGIDRTHPCKQCKKSFTSVGKLKDHVKLRHNRDNRNKLSRYKFNCIICNRHFGSRVALDRHQSTDHSSGEVYLN